jgi:ATP-dependent helicase/nuclease subunit B
MKPRIYTVPPGIAFLPALARAILDGNLPAPDGAKPDPLHLPDITLLLPTRRATRAAQDAFLAASGARALLMPRIRPISEGEEDLTLLTSFATPPEFAAEVLELPEPVSPLVRTLTLMRLIERWRANMAENEGTALSDTPAQAASLAIELGNLMDEVERENVAFEKIKELVPENFSDHWQKTIEFLKIVSDFKAMGFTSEVETRNALILAEAQRLATHPLKAPVIVAGVTGSIPATVALMKAVTALPNGAIVLPALDLCLDSETWNDAVTQHPEHPQFSLNKLLGSLGIAREDVSLLPGIAPTAGAQERNIFVSEAMRPASTTERWHSFTEHAVHVAIRDALSGVSLISAPSAQDEAEVVALILREAVETPGRTAALVSPDRLLARRVAIRLESWGIRVDDSAGRPFAKTVPGTFLNLVIAAMVSGFAPADVMALLKHPLCRLGQKPFDIRRFSRALEIAAFRAPYLGRGLDGIAAALAHFAADGIAKKRQHAAAKRLWDEDIAGASDIVARLVSAYAPLTRIYAADGTHALSLLADAHCTVAEALTALPEEDPAFREGISPLWQGEAGEAANTFFVKLHDTELPEVAIRAVDYADLYQSLLARENVRERTPVHPRVSIWGPFEARLQQPDIMVLGSLNEGTWPEAAETGAWLNRPMRKELGLPSPEEDTGRSAHDFTSLLGAERVYLTRAEKVKGVPTVPSRWLMRMTALLKGLGLEDALQTERPWLAWARSRDHVEPLNRKKISAPEPKPVLALRPRKLSVTRVEDWITNPYAIFASQILKLEPLPPLGLSPDQSLRGGLVHDVLSKFTEKYPAALPPDALAVLKHIAEQHLEHLTGHPKVAAFWMPRLVRFLEWFAMTEPQRRNGIRHVATEISGELVIAAPSGPFTLSARADRIDDDGKTLIITDYKTGIAPNAKQVREGRAPQLPLEAAIAMGEIGFPNLTPRTVSALRYIRASGGEPPGEERFVEEKDVPALARMTLDGLTALIAAFDDPMTPYRAIRRPGYRYDYDDYAHLARVAEWSAHAEEEGAA